MSDDSDRRPPERAVALRYDGTGAPRVTAKGSGATAERILALAREHDIPLHEDPELVALLSRVPLGEEIPAALYLAVARVIAFAYLVAGRLPPEADDPATAPSPRTP